MMVKVSIGEGLDATFAKKCAKFRHGSIATSSFLGRLGYLLSASSFQLPASSFQLPASGYQLPATSYQLRVMSFGLRVFWGLFHCSELGGIDRLTIFVEFGLCLDGLVGFSTGVGA